MQKFNSEGFFLSLVTMDLPDGCRVHVFENMLVWLY